MNFLQQHYFIIIIVIIVLVIFQTRSFLSTRRKLNIFRTIFPNNDDEYGLFEPDTDSNALNISTIHRNPVLKKIVETINSYLSSNAGAVSDFHLIKDIVDRNCDAREEEINTQIPVPLYLGLTGTMAGILIGLGSLVIHGGVEAVSNEIKNVNPLLDGVALAMITSIVGIILTTVGSLIAKNSKSDVEQNKNLFFGWIQKNLSPNSPKDVTSVLAKMAKNLRVFNESFSSNTLLLQGTIQKIQAAYTSQADIAQANKDIYDRLNDFSKKIDALSKKINNLGEHLESVDKYVEAMNTGVTQMNTFFEREIQQIEERKGAISRIVGEIDDQLKTAIVALKDTAEIQLNEWINNMVAQTDAWQKALNEQTEHIQAAFAEQRNILEQELQNTPQIVAQLRDIPDIKAVIVSLNQATAAQNDKLDRLISSIEQLAATRVKSAQPSFMPKWVQMTALSIGGVIAISLLFFIVVLIYGLSNMP
jgi:hypothetical protein